MASTYVNDLRLNEMATGDASGSWGTNTNTNLELIGEALGFGTETITTNADTHASTIADGATDPIRAIFIKYAGTLDSACTITIGPNTVNKFCFIHNATSGSQSIIISQGSGANVTIATGQTKGVYLDGGSGGAAVVDAFATLSVVDLNVSGNLDVDGTANLDAVDIDGAVQIDNTVSVGVNDTGYDVKFFGDTASAFMLWDASADDLILGGAAGLSVNSAALVTGVLTTTAATVFNGGFASNDGSTISTADNTTQLTLISTDADANSGPNLDFYRNSASPADDDLLARIKIQGKNDAGQDVLYSFIDTYAHDVTDGTEDGGFYIYRMMGGSSVESLSFTATEAVFNESSKDYDFRVESDGNANMLFVDGGNNRVGIGTNTPQVGTLHVHTATAGTVTASVQADDLVVESNTEAGITILSPDDQSARIRFSSPSTNTDVGGASILYRQNINLLKVGTAVAGGILRLTSGADVEALNIDGNGVVTKPKQPAFLAQPASQQANLALNTTHTIVFGTERFDQNADFASNTFTAPVTGKYQLNVNLYLTNLDLDVSYYQFELQTSNRIYYFIQGTTGFDADQNFQMLGMSILADMDASDTAIVRLPNLNAGAAQLDVGTGSSFSGYLVA